MLPLRCLGYGVSPRAFCDYFQMSATLARACFLNFINDMTTLWCGEYLSMPSGYQIKQLTNLHEKVHGVPGLLGSLDCMHCRWHQCPKAYHGAFQGSKGCPTIVMETVSDFNMYFWHVAFGFPGSLNDLNILNLSPIIDAFVDGTFETSEQLFVIGKEEFHDLYLLVDDIYPNWNRFVNLYSLLSNQSNMHTKNGRREQEKILNKPLECSKVNLKILIILSVI